MPSRREISPNLSRPRPRDSEALPGDPRTLWTGAYGTQKVHLRFSPKRAAHLTRTSATFLQRWWHYGHHGDHRGGLGPLHGGQDARGGVRRARNHACADNGEFPFPAQRAARALPHAVDARAHHILSRRPPRRRNKSSSRRSWAWPRATRPTARAKNKLCRSPRAARNVRRSSLY